MHAARVLQVLLAFCPSVASAAACLHYDLPDITLQGHVVRGAPLTTRATNGSDSQADRSWYFVTTRSLCITGGNNNLPVKATRRFEIWPPGGHENFDLHVGHTVKITGHFLPTYIPHFHSYLIFGVTSVEAPGAPGL